MYMLNMVIILIVMYCNVVTAIDKIPTYLLHFNRWGHGVSEAMSRHPTYKESHDAASETQHPQVRNVIFICLPGDVALCAQARALAHRGHGVSHESLVDGHSLNVRRNDDSVFP